MPVYPLTIVCPACNAQPGERCTIPTVDSRRPVEWFHLSRETRAEEANYG